MQYGEHVCMLGCGITFLGGSALAASMILQPEEIRKIRKTWFILFPVLSLFSIGAFICAGGGLVLDVAVFWFFGSLIGGLGMLELGWLTRRFVTGH